MKIKCIAIDDEPLALERIQKTVEKVEYLDWIQSFTSVSEALKFLSKEVVDCIFLDIEMPDLNGIEFSKIVHQFINKPEIVFVTAYGQYAIKKYQVAAIGFLLKPFSYEDFKIVAEKIKIAWYIKQETAENIRSFFIRVDAQQVKINPNDILYLESMGDYVKIFMQNKKSPFIPLITLRKIKTYLPASLFVQINRSQIVNFRRISTYTASALSLAEKNFTVSESYRKEFEVVKRILTS